MKTTDVPRCFAAGTSSLTCGRLVVHSLRVLLVGAGLTALPEARSFGADAAQAPVSEGVPATERDRLQPDTVYRYDPLSSRFFPVPDQEIKPERVYSRFDRGAGRHVWSLAVKGGGFRHRIGPGSIQPAERFDIRATAAEKRAELESRAPEAAKLLAVQGTRPSLVLDESGRWGLHTGPAVRQVFDESNGRRWEWHGEQPTPIVHAFGDAWYRDSDGYRPLGPGGPAILVPLAADCWY
jgi:hypothetical protein